MSNGASPITIVGNIVDNPEVRFTKAGVACANFSVAVNHKTFDPTTKKWEDNGVDFYRVTAWRSLAENIADSVGRGDRVIVFAEQKSSQYEDREGNKRTSWELTARAVGPDLMFASAEVKKTEYHKGNEKAPETKTSRARR